MDEPRKGFVDPDDWRNVADHEEEHNPEAQEAREMFLKGRALDDEGPTFHPLALTELEQRRLRRAVRPSKPPEGDKAA